MNKITPKMAAELQKSAFVTNSTLVQRASRIAQEAHRGQKRKWGPEGRPTDYVLHPARVASCVARHCDPATGYLPNDVDVAAAWLHDVLEDCVGWSASRIVSELMDKEGVEKSDAEMVAGTVVWLTKVSDNHEHKNKPREERKKLDFQQIAKAPVNAQRIKLADRLDNVLELDHAPEDFAKQYCRETALLLQAIGGADFSLTSLLKQEIVARGKLGYVTREVLRHYSCGACEKWWSVADGRDAGEMTCPHCGTKQSFVDMHHGLTESQEAAVREFSEAVSK